MSNPVRIASNRSGPITQVGDSSKSAKHGGLLRQASTVAGNADTRILATRNVSANRSHVFIHNCDATYDLWVFRANLGDSAPTISATDRDFVVGPGKYVEDEKGSEVEYYVRNSSGAATTTNFVAGEMRR